MGINRILTLVALCYLSGLPVYAQTRADSLLQTVSELPDKQKLDSISAWCWSHREKDPVLSLTLAEKGLELADRTGSVAHKARLSNYAGVIHLHYRFDFNSAIPFFHVARDVSVQNGDSVQLAYAYNNLGDAYYLAKNTGLAKNLAQLSMDIFLKLNDTLGIAYSFVNLGLAARLEGQTEVAKEYFHQAIKISEPSDTQNTIAYTLLEIGRTLILQDSLDKAVQQLTTAYRMHIDMGNIIYGAHCLTAIADVLYTRGDFENAFTHYQEALAMNKTRNHEYGQITNRLKMALIHSQWHMRKEGEQELNEAIALCEKMGLPDKLLEAYLTQAEFYTNLGDQQAAIDNFGRFLTRSNELFSQQQFAILEEIKKQNETQWALYRAQQEMRTQDTLQVYIFIILILAMLAVMLITWRYVSTRQLNRELTKSNQTKDKIFSIIAHDLRKPLASIMQTFELLTEESLSEEKKSVLIKSLQTQTDNTYSLLENLLSLSASRSGKLTFKPKTINLYELINNQLDLIQTDLQRKKLVVHTQLNQSHIRVDPEMFQIVIRNLITNALKYSYPGKEIFIFSEKVEEAIIIRVKDEGTGMTNQTLNTLFADEFVSSAQGTAGENGTGIGLSLCKEIIHRHRGTIQAKSSPGQGAEFIISLPENQN